MDLSIHALAASLLVSGAGFGLFLYGKKEGRMPQLLAGLVMLGCPYFAPGAGAIWAVGAVTVACLLIALRQDL